jgi:hypothetical protein
MCLFPPTPEAPSMPTEYAAQKSPDAGAVRSTTGRRTADMVRSGSPTILTSGSGVTTTALTEKKTLLGA